MTLDELIETLTELRDQLGEDVPVRVAFQPNYPLAACVAHVRVMPLRITEVGDEEHPAVWIATSSSVPYGENPYATRKAWDEE